MTENKDFKKNKKYADFFLIVFILCILTAFHNR